MGRAFLTICALLLLSSLALAAQAMYSATLTVENITATTRYVLVDLSDTSAYPHTDSNGLRLFRIQGNLERREGAFDLRIGVVLENDATDGSAQWLYSVRLENDDQTTDDHAQRTFALDFAAGVEGYQLVRVASSESQRTVSNDPSGNVTWLQSDAGDLRDATGATTKSAGAGDLVLEVEEIADTGALDLSINVLYTAE